MITIPSVYPLWLELRHKSVCALTKATKLQDAILSAMDGAFGALVNAQTLL